MRQEAVCRLKHLHSHMWKGVPQLLGALYEGGPHCPCSGTPCSGCSCVTRGGYMTPQAHAGV
jgi:hypothetical protein